MNIYHWIIDTQDDFMSNNEKYKGKLPIAGAEVIISNLEKLIQIARKKGIPIIQTGDLHTSESKELSATPDYVNTFPEHCLQYTRGAEFIPATKLNHPKIIDWRDKSINLEEISEEKEIIIYKDEFDVFSGNPYTDEIVNALKKSHKMDYAIVSGVATDFCVHYAVMGLLKRGVIVYVPLDATKPISDSSSNYREWQKRGAQLTTTKQIPHIINKILENERNRFCNC